MTVIYVFKAFINIYEGRENMYESEPSSEFYERFKNFSSTSELLNDKDLVLLV